MKKCYLFILFLGLWAGTTLNAQPYPDLELSMDVATAPTGTAVDLSVRAGQNFQNITNLT